MFHIIYSLDPKISNHRDIKHQKILMTYKLNAFNFCSVKTQYCGQFHAQHTRRELQTGLIA